MINSNSSGNDEIQILKKLNQDIDLALASLDNAKRIIDKAIMLRISLIPKGKSKLKLVR